MQAGHGLAWVGALIESFDARALPHTSSVTLLLQASCCCGCAGTPAELPMAAQPATSLAHMHGSTALQGAESAAQRPRATAFQRPINIAVQRPRATTGFLLTHQKLLPGPCPPAYGQHPHPQELGRAARSPRLQYVSVHHAQLVPVEGREVGTEGGHEGCRQLEGGSKQRDARCE